VKIRRTSKKGFFNFDYLVLNRQIRSCKLLISDTEVSFASFNFLRQKLAILESSKLIAEELMNSACYVRS
jgi:hypothetical protein